MRLRAFLFAAACAVLAGLAFEIDALRRGLDAFRRRDFRSAEREFAEAAKAKPDSVRAWKLLGMTYIAEEKYEPAEEPFRKACDLDPREENACFYLGRLDFTLGRFDKSLEAYRKVLANGGDRGR